MKNKVKFTAKTLFHKFLLISLFLLVSACNKKSDIAISENQNGQGQPASDTASCGLANNTCLVGTPTDTNDTNAEYLWTCKGPAGADVACHILKPVNGACGITKNTCLSGTFNDVADTETQMLWTCKGAGAGTDSSCAMPQPPLDTGCVQVFYDRTGDEQFRDGRSYALMIINLLGHFPEHQAIVGPIELYRKGDLDRCLATFYIGSTRDNLLPQDFINEYKTTTKQVIWMGYSFWELGAEFEKDFGYKTYEMTTVDYKNTTPAPDSKPGFFRDIIYKGETFPKYNVWTDATHKTIDAPWEMAKLTGKSSDVATVLGEARHSVTGETIPWALQNGNRYFISEVPLSYFHEADRYFVFADLMFDFLKEAPKHNGKYAFIRLEDIGAMETLSNLQEAVDILTRNSVPVHMNLYPIFNDPLFAVSGHSGVPMIRMENATAFSNAIKNDVTAGATIIWHGVTHQYSNIKNPYSGASGDDYEFWNSNTNSPIAEDSVSYVLDKMEDGFKSLKLVGIEPRLWVIPHYEASALDNVMFGQMFPWMVSRGVYIDNKIEGLQTQDPGKPIYFSIADTDATNKNRRDFFSNLKVTPDQTVRFGQIFPYELYGDIYLQHVVPEDLGNVEPVLSQQVQFVRTVDTILQDAKRNLVLRDVWASVFYHPYLLDPNENDANKDITKPKDLERLVTGIKNMGYNFISLSEWIGSHKDPVNLPRIELQDTRK